MKSIFAKILALLCIMVTMGCMGLMDIGDTGVEPIIGRYYMVWHMGTVYAIAKTDARNSSPTGQYIISGVRDLDWNDKYIVVKHLYYGPNINGERPEEIHWYIIDAINEQMYGPYQYDQYQEERTKLDVPNKLEFLKPDEEQLGAYQRKHNPERQH